MELSITVTRKTVGGRGFQEKDHKFSVAYAKIDMSLRYLNGYVKKSTVYTNPEFRGEFQLKIRIQSS
jgi:hypothetical protein